MSDDTQILCISAPQPPPTAVPVPLASSRANSGSSSKGVRGDLKRPDVPIVVAEGVQVLVLAQGQFVPIAANTRIQVSDRVRVGAGFGLPLKGEGDDKGEG